MKAFIRGTGVISPQETHKGNGFPSTLHKSANNLMRCIEPSYLDYLNPVMARRMGRIIKMGIASAMLCMKDSRLDMPDAIVTGTALGCLGDTEKFLKAIIADDEQFLTPTSFIQSIQNTVSAQIALHLNCTNHNFTFVHKGFSFESALLDAMMLMEEKEAEHVLVGGLDEMTDHNYFFYDKLGIWKKTITSSDDLLNSTSPGTIGGEGSAFFVISKEQSETDYARLLAVNTLYEPDHPVAVGERIQHVLADSGMTMKDIDLVLYGFNGDARTDYWYQEVMNRCFPETTAAWFKHLCGEYQTSGAFALWLAATVLKYQQVPAEVLIEKRKSERLSHILVYNSYEKNHSLYLVAKA